MRDFYRQLEDYAATGGEAREAIAERLWREHGVEEAVFILDLSGFSRTADEHGIVHCLSLIQRVRIGLRPVIEASNGSIVKFEADNCFARFRDTHHAIEAAIRCHDKLDALNATEATAFQFKASIGIDFGWFLLVGGDDFFGVPVNIASKLGEDTAEPGQILVTDRVLERLDDPNRFQTRAQTVHLSGIRIDAHEIVYR